MSSEPYAVLPGIRLIGLIFEMQCGILIKRSGAMTRQICPCNVDRLIESKSAFAQYADGIDYIRAAACRMRPQVSSVDIKEQAGQLLL